MFVLVHSHGRISWSIFTKIGTIVRFPQKEKWVHSGLTCSVSMHKFVNIKILDAKWIVYAKDKQGFTNYYTDLVNVWSAVGQKGPLFRRFKSV